MDWDSDWNNRCTTANYCENNPSDEICTATRNTSWVGEVALMYPSDEYLVYANGVDGLCYGEPDKCVIECTTTYGSPNSGWIYNSNNLEGQDNINWNWFVSPSAKYTNQVFGFYPGGILNCYSANNSYAVRPVLYLSSNVKITDGTGEQNNPYKLGL